jgi:hypothetical protein
MKTKSKHRSYREFSNSRFLKKDDVGEEEQVVTIINVTEENVARDADPEDIKLAAHLVEFDKPVVLNWTNMSTFADITGTDDFTKWKNFRAVIFNDLTVHYGNEKGGIRFKKLKPTSKVQPRSQPQTPKNDASYSDDDINPELGAL